VLGNGVDTSRYRPPAPGERIAVRRELGLPTEEPLLLFVGRFVPKKGFPMVAAAVSDDYRIVFAGGDRPPGVDDERLLFLGSMPPERLARVYRSVDAFVVASVGECPLTVLEAMSSGLPVLVNDDPALHSPWTAGPGVRFVDMAGGDLRRAVEELFSDLDSMRRTGEDARSVVRREFSWEVHTDRLEAVYADVLTNDTT
jgi:glycosyltransferase involved in cell wall biosynthesis